MPSKVKKVRYPYEIPPSPPAQQIEEFDPWDVLEFFRVEALLRSPKVMKLYKETYAAWDHEDPRPDTLAEKYAVAVGWRALTHGAHHHFQLAVPENLSEIAPGIEDLRWTAALPIGQFQEQFDRSVKELRETLYKGYREYDEYINKTPDLWLAISKSHPPEAIINRLRPILKQHLGHQDLPIKKPRTLSPYKMTHPYHPKKKPRIHGKKGIKTWLERFKCYDLRCQDGLTFGQIADQVYQNKPDKPRARDRAEKAVARVKRLIEAAESNNWPPPKIA